MVILLYSKIYKCHTTLTPHSWLSQSHHHHQRLIFPVCVCSLLKVTDQVRFWLDSQWHIKIRLWSRIRPGCCVLYSFCVKRFDVFILVKSYLEKTFSRISFIFPAIFYKVLSYLKLLNLTTTTTIILLSFFFFFSCHTWVVTSCFEQRVCLYQGVFCLTVSCSRQKQGVYLCVMNGSAPLC